jgi:hypothetical protein
MTVAGAFVSAAGRVDPVRDEAKHGQRANLPWMAEFSAGEAMPFREGKASPSMFGATISQLLT